MEPSEPDTDALINGLRAGDSRAINEFCKRYQPALERLADGRLPPGLRRRLGAEDIVQSVCRTFLRRTLQGEFDIQQASGLWSLLCAITLTKVREQARFHLRRRRGLDQEDNRWANDVPSSMHPAAAGLTPAESAEFADQFEQVMSTFDDEERKLINLKLEERPLEDMTAALNCSERTIRRILKRIAVKLARAFEVN